MRRRAGLAAPVAAGDGSVLAARLAAQHQKASGTEIATVSSAPKTPLAGFGRGFEQTSERAKAANATPAAAAADGEGEWSSSAARTQVARLKAGGVRYERRALELDNDAIRVGDQRVPLAALRRVAVTESKELEFSVDCGDDGALHLRAADADELELWVTSLGEVVEANAHAANGSQRRAPELAAGF